jgi:hypothetical protein
VSRAAGGLLVAALLAALLLGGLSGACRRSRLPPRADGAAVVVTAPEVAGFAADVKRMAEAEPNESIATAQKLDLTDGAGLGVVAKLEVKAAPPPAAPAATPAKTKGKGKAKAATPAPATDVDVYRIDLPPPAPGAPPRRRLMVEARPDEALGVTVDALDDKGQPLVSSTGAAAGEPDGMPNLSVGGGTYYLRVRSSQPGAQGGYRLFLRLSALEVGEEVEPNGKAALATEVGSTGEAVGYHGWRRDQDWYRVPLAGLTEGSVLSGDLEPVPGVTATMAVYDSVEHKLSETRGRKEERIAFRNIRLPLTEPHVFVEVRTDAGRNLEGRYSLRLRTEVGKAGGELEPNDDAAHATPLVEGTVLGYLGRGDMDIYRYTASGPFELGIEVTAPERVDVKLEAVRATDGSPISTANEGRRQEPERIANLYTAGGPMLIRLTAAKGDGNPDEPYRLTLTSRLPEPGAEREPNGGPATATALTLATPGTGLIFPRGDIDTWQIAATPDAEGNVPVSMKGVPGMTLDVRVLSQGEKEVGRFKVSGDASGSSRVVTGGETCCLVQIREISGKISNFRDRYVLTVGR